MVRRLKYMLREVQEQHVQNISQTGQNVDLGAGVLVRQTKLTRLEQTYKDQPSKFARSLMRVLFTDEEMVNKSLFGLQANSNKDKEAKPALDPARVKAVLEHTSATFRCSEAPLKRSLSSMLQKLNAKHAVDK
ncbi:uncharacterized protein LOC135371614 [Ornithodoros turicata]|uniref:uncharacterized protein LOC135371614 n=1 Tax=Ornithodoros turicata TaxID=34597 RepID=UPI0031395048